MDLDKIIFNMTLEEKASLMSGKDFWQTVAIARHGIPSIFLADGPHGIRKQVKAADHLGLNASYNATCFPTAATVANSWNTDIGKQLGECLGTEALFYGVNVLLGPGLNIKRNPLCGRNFEYFSEDPYLAGKMAAAYITGIQSTGVAACAKHFAANNQETKRMTIDSVIDERTLREIYLTGFEIAIKEGNVKCVMSAYNPINGTYANENMHLLKDILKDEWGFNGVVVTDWGGNNDRVAALKAGNQLEMPSNCGETNLEIIEAVKKGYLEESYLNLAVKKLLHLVFDTDNALKNTNTQFNKERHHEVAQLVAQESIVLLKNDDSILPLNNSLKVAIIGDFAKNPRYQGAGSSVVNPTMLENTLDNLFRYDINFAGYQQGYNRYGKNKPELISRAVKLAKESDVILLYIGLDEASETEGLDRNNIQLPQNQINLLKKLSQTNKKIIAIVSCGSVIDMQFTQYCNAVIHGYLGGQAGSKAMLNVLVGKVNPSGKLAESYPIKYSDCASAANFPAQMETAEYREGLFVGYRYYTSANVAVKYPFGYGLSYTTFKYSDIIVSPTSVKFNIKNTGNFAGAEVAQLYVGATNSLLFRAERELKGFAKVYLQPNEEKNVEILFDEYTFRYFDIANNAWCIEPCTYNIMIGASSQDIRLCAQLQCGDTTLKITNNKDVLPSYYLGKVSNVTSKEFETLLARKLPDCKPLFIKRNRIYIGFNTSIADLRYARGFTGRAFARMLRFLDRLLRLFGKSSLANVLRMGVYSMPIRGLSRMTGGALSWGQLRGLLLMFNGHFFKGVKVLAKEGKINKRRKKLIKKQQKLNKNNW